MVDLERRLCIVAIDQGRYPKGVTFAERSYAVVGGSDNGRVYVFERRTGKVIMTLKYAKREGAETVAVGLFILIVVKTIICLAAYACSSD